MQCEINVNAGSNTPNKTMDQLRAGKGQEGLWRIAGEVDRGDEDYHLVVRPTLGGEWSVLRLERGGDLRTSTLMDQFEMQYVGPCRVTVDLINN